MSSRTTTSKVTFLHTFVVGGYDDELPAGTYSIIAEDEVVADLGLPAYRRTATHILINRYAEARPSELRSFNRRDLELALVQDQACSSEVQNSGAALSPSKDQI